MNRAADCPFKNVPDSLKNIPDSDLVREISPEGFTVSAEFIRHDLMPLAETVLADFSEFRKKRSEASRPGIFIVIIAGGVSSGKSSAALMLKKLLTRTGIRTETVSSDGFIYPSAWLDEHQLMDKKGFPVSYDVKYMEDFLKAAKNPSGNIAAPLYSHRVYDRLPDTRQIIPRDTDILIFEGVNLLAPAEEYGLPGIRAPGDYADLVIYIDAPESLAESWHRKRCLDIILKTRNSPGSFFSRYAGMSAAEIENEIRRVWESINHVNLIKYIIPYAGRADIRVPVYPEHRLGGPERRSRNRSHLPETEE